MRYCYKYLILLLLLSIIAVQHSCKQKSNQQHEGHEQHAERQVTDTGIHTLLQSTNQFIVSSIPVTTIQRNEQPVEVKAFGSISYDTRQAGTVSARYAGRIEKLYVRYRFQKVTKGQKIMDIYSPELMTAQQNLLFLLRNDEANLPLINASKQRLQLLGMTSQQIASIIKTGKPLLAVPVFSNYTGHIHEATVNAMPAMPQGAMKDISITTEELSLRPGMYIQKGQSLFSIFNPNKVWATLNIYGNVHMFVKRGASVTIIPETATAKQIHGKIDFIEPFFREGSKTITARVYFDNSKLQVPIGSQVSATIFTRVEDAEWLPASAVVSLGTDKVAFIKQKDGFKARRLLTGISYNDMIQVVSGLTTKDTVAQNAQFLTDSESFIKVND